MLTASTPKRLQATPAASMGITRPQPKVEQMDAAEHWQAWLERYRDDYATDEERRAAYRDFKANLARLTDAADWLRERDSRDVL